MTELLTGKPHQRETEKAIQACNDFLRLGRGRSLVVLHRKYTENYYELPPTTVYQTLKDWSSKYDWSGRASLYDAEWDERKNAERSAELDFGLSLDFERIRRLKRLADLLEAQIYELSEPDDDGNRSYVGIWVRDVKQIGSGDNIQRVDIERFNGTLISEYRAVLDDLAKEVGDRKLKTEFSGSVTWESVVKQAIDDTDNSDPYA